MNVKDIQFKATEEKICKNPNEINVVSVGRLTFQKGFDIGVEVIKHLVEDGYPIQWYLIGEGSQRKELEELIRKSGVAQKHIKLLGRQLNPYPYISMAIFAHFSNTLSFYRALNVYREIFTESICPFWQIVNASKQRP